MRYTCFFNSRDKVGINFIKNSCAFHMLLKKVTRVTFINQIEENELETRAMHRYVSQNDRRKKRIKST